MSTRMLQPFSPESLMRVPSLGTAFAAFAAVLLTMSASSSAHAQPPRSGGFDFTYGFATGSGGDFRDRKGSLNSVEVLFSTRIDGGNSTVLLGAQAIYFAGDDGDGECILSQVTGQCTRSFPDVAGAGLIVAYEPLILANTFLSINGGLAFVQPSSDGGPTIGWLGAAKVGQSIGRHLALLAGGRIIAVPNMRGESVTIPAFMVGLRLR
jgi:hypothetical protein